ncbi:MAG TPA: YdeI/OmpD-associated family protein [Conexibacter sp.]|jgi:hypothetical protein
MGEITFTTTLQRKGPAAAVVLDDEQAATVGGGAKRFPVRATIGGYSWRTTVARMRGEFLVGMSREVRAGAGAEAGDEVEVVIVLDEEPRTVDVPEALEQALNSDAAARAAFDGLSYTDRKEYARWVAEAKREETRDRRIARTLERVKAGRAA